MATEPIVGAGLGTSNRQAVTSDGLFFYAVWQRGAAGYLSRITDQGELLDRDGIAIDTGGLASGAAILWNGSHLLVAWASTDGLHCRIFDRAGRPAGDIENLGVPGLTPRVAWNGSNFLIVGEHYENGLYSVEGALVDSRGKKIARLTQLARDAASPTVASDGSGFVVVFATGFYEEGALEAIHLDGAGRVQRRAFVDATFRAIPSITHDGKQYVLVYTMERTVVLRTLANDLATIGPVRTLASPDGSPAQTAIVWNGSEYLVAFEELFFSPIPEAPPRSKLWGVHLDRNLLANTPRAISSGSFFELPLAPAVSMTPSLAWNGVRFFAVWTHALQSYDFQVRTSLLSPDGIPLQSAAPVLAGIPISVSAQMQNDPEIAFGKTCTWRSGRRFFPPPARRKSSQRGSLARVALSTGRE